MMMSVTNLLAQTGISLYSVLVEVLQSYRYAHVRLLSHTTSLMTGKACTLYVKVFEKLQEIVPEFSPTTVMADFENASVGAMKKCIWTNLGCSWLLVSFFAGCRQIRSKNWTRSCVQQQ